jgi:hypothetical protein
LIQVLYFYAGIMASTSVDQVGRRQPVTFSSKPALVAYSDSDTKTSSDAPDLQARSSDDLMAAEVLTALSVAKANSTEYLVNDNPTPTSAGMNQHKKAATNEFEPIAEGSGRSGQAEIVYKPVNDDGDTILHVDETQHVEFETTFTEANEVHGSNNKPRCWGDIKYPRVGTCDHEFKIVNKGERYRKVVSDFFGRNKKATASVSPDCYPTICRACYQRLVYRLGSMNKDEPEKDVAAVAKLRCDAIIAALEKMKGKKFVDRNGHEWPWWCGLELQLTNDGQALLETPELLEAEIEKKNGEVAKQKAEKAKSPKGKSFKRLHKRVKPKYLPDWLQRLCQANTEDTGTDDVATSTIGDRNGVRYSFDELILIIKAVKTFCHESRCAFPTIEAIPVSIGLLDKQIVKEKRKLRAAANKMKSDTKKAAVEAERQARDQPNNSFRKKIASHKRKEANDALAEAGVRKRDIDHAQEDALMSAGTKMCMLLI